MQGLIAAIALGSLASTSNGTVTQSVPLAIGMGIAAAVFAVAKEWLGHVAAWFYSLLGICAFIPAAITFVSSNGCLPGPPPAIRFAVVLLLTLIAVVLFAASFLTLRKAPSTATGLALFGALQVLITAGNFIAGDADPQNWIAIALLVPCAAMLGWFVVKFADAVLGVAAVASGMQSIYAAGVDSACADANFSGVAMIVVFCGAYFATRAVCAPFASRR